MRLTRKYAEMIDGIDLTDAHVGDHLKLPRHDAEMLIAEGWAERTATRQRKRSNEVRSIGPETPNSSSGK